MKFVCDQDWDAMPAAGCGKFCDQCQKEVKDFTSYSKAEVSRDLARNPNQCGRFKIEQVDPDIIAPLKVPFPRQMSVYLASVLMLLGAKTAFSQETVPHPMVQVEKVTDRADRPDCHEEWEMPQHVCHENCGCVTAEEPQKTKRYKRKKRLYTSWSFPFISFRRPLVLGKRF